MSRKMKYVYDQFENSSLYTNYKPDHIRGSVDFAKHLLEKANYQCQNCGSRDKLEFHHIVPNGSKLASNIAVLCKSCHCKAHQTQLHIHKVRRVYERKSV